jgi:hypothetical protein
VARDGANVVITFSGTLKSSASVTGPYQAVTGAAPPTYTVTPGSTQQFFIAE